MPCPCRRLGACLALMLISAAAQAANTTGTGPLESTDSVWIQVNPGTGLINSLPATIPAELIGRMEAMRAGLRAQKTRLARIAQERRFSPRDALVSIVLPGGLLYAAMVQQRHYQAAERAKEASARLDEMNRNLAEYRSILFGSPLMVATRQ